jgi:ribosomal protein L11 methyltransferase
MTITRVEILAEKGVEEALPPEFYLLCNGVWIEDFQSSVLIKCYPSVVATFLDYLTKSGLPVERTTVVEEEEKDYAEEVRRQFTNLRIGDVTVVPPWRRTRRKGRAIIIEPGMAFGTGRHESTRLMMKMMRAINFSGKRVLDIGTGSGILAFYASMLGASDVLAIDNDPLATEAVRKGLVMNNIDNLAVKCTDLTKVRGRFDIVLANLEFGIFEKHAGDVVKRVSDDGTLMISGIEAQYGKQVLPLFRPHKLVIKRKMGDWHGYVFQRVTQRGKVISQSKCTRHALRGSHAKA